MMLHRRFMIKAVIVEWGWGDGCQLSFHGKLTSCCKVTLYKIHINSYFFIEINPWFSCWSNEITILSFPHAICIFKDNCHVLHSSTAEKFSKIIRGFSMDKLIHEQKHINLNILRRTSSTMTCNHLEYLIVKICFGNFSVCFSNTCTLYFTNEENQQMSLCEILSSKKLIKKKN